MILKNLKKNIKFFLKIPKKIHKIYENTKNPIFLKEISNILKSQKISKNHFF